MTALHLTVDTVPGREDSQILRASSLDVRLPQPPEMFYRHGWQSWSLTAWTDAQHEFPVMKPYSFHNRQTDPLYARDTAPNGSWLGAVEFAPDDILLLGALGLGAHVALREGQLQGWYESGGGDWFLGRGRELETFARYAALLGKRFCGGPRKSPPRLWCSWYSLHDRIAEKDLLEVLDGLGDLPFDVFQVDDGWQQAPGDWEPNGKFPSGMAVLANRIRASGRQAGLWLAPLSVGKSSTIFKRHPEWLLKDLDGRPRTAGFEWSTETFALDTTHPGAAEWLRNLIRKTRDWGYDYLKLDFLYAGALPGRRHTDTPRETAYRQALEIIREAAGDAYLLLCGTPILPSLGVCDAIRIGADVGNTWDSRFYSYFLYNQTAPGLRNAIRTSVNRLWLRQLVNLDPDVAFFSGNGPRAPEHQGLFRDLTEICGVKATSDLPQGWSNANRAEIRRWLESSPPIQHTGRYTFKVGGRCVDFGPAMPLPPQPRNIDALLGAVLGALGNQVWALKLWHGFLRYTRP